jgi:hypothetical protein
MRTPSPAPFISSKAAHNAASRPSPHFHARFTRKFTANAGPLRTGQRIATNSTNSRRKACLKQGQLPEETAAHRRRTRS